MTGGLMESRTGWQEERQKEVKDDRRTDGTKDRMTGQRTKAEGGRKEGQEDRAENKGGWQTKRRQDDRRKDKKGKDGRRTDKKVGQQNERMTGERRKKTE